jgi:hypothetical protein
MPGIDPNGRNKNAERIWYLGIGLVVAATVSLWVNQARPSSPPPSVKRADTATQEPSSVPLGPQKQALPAIDGPFGLKFGTPFTGVDRTKVAGACHLARPISGTVLADISDLKDRLTFEEATQRIGAADGETCLIGMSGTLAFVFVPYFGASDDTKKLLDALPDEFDRRFGRVKPHLFHTTEDVGIFGHDIQPISVMRYSWNESPERVELVAPFTIFGMVPTFSEAISYVLYIDGRRIDDLKKAKLKAEADSRAQEQHDQEHVRHAVKQF